MRKNTMKPSDLRKPSLYYSWVFTLILISCSHLLFGAKHAIAALAGTVAYLEAEEPNLVILDPAKPKQKIKLPLPERYHQNYGSMTADHLALDRDGKFLYWGIYGHIWRHQLKDHQPAGDWQLLLDFPESQGHVNAFHLNKKGDQMLLFLDLDRQHLTSERTAVPWNCRSIIHADVTESGIFLSEPLLVSDHLSSPIARFIDDDQILAEVYDERTGGNYNLLFKRIVANQWQADSTEVFPGLQMREDAAGEHYPKYLYLSSRSGGQNYHFAIYEEKSQSIRTGQSVSRGVFYLEDDDHLIHPAWPLLPDSGNFFQITPAFFGRNVVATRLFKEGSGADQSCETQIFYPTRAVQENNFSAYADIMMAGVAHVSAVAHQYALIHKTDCRGAASQLYLLNFNSGTVQFLDYMP